MSRQAALFHNRERRRALSRERSFSAQIASPFDLGSAAAAGDSPNPLVLLDSINVAVSFSAAITAGQLTIDTNRGKTLGTLALAADEIHRLGFFEKNVSLTPSCAIAGDVTIYILSDRRIPSVVATGTFT